MKTRIALAAALLAASTGFAAAQTPPPPPPPGAEAPMPPGEGPPPRPGEEMRDGERGPHGGRGPHGRGPGRDGASFQLRMGDARLMVDCGAEALAPCIAASRPLIDLVGEDVGPSGMPRPPAADLTVPPIPPASGDMAPDMPETDTPPVTPAN